MSAEDRFTPVELRAPRGSNHVEIVWADGKVTSYSNELLRFSNGCFVLESMTPAERVAFVLHDVFAYPFADVAEIVGRTPPACRQLASSARRRLRGSRGPATSTDKRAEIVRDFKRAWQAKDVGALIGLLDPGVKAFADGGGVVNAELRPVEGDGQVARVLIDVLDKASGLTIMQCTVNGQSGLVVQRDGITGTVLAFDIAGERITRIWAVRNPEKLRCWAVG